MPSNLIRGSNCGDGLLSRNERSQGRTKPAPLNEIFAFAIIAVNKQNMSLESCAPVSVFLQFPGGYIQRKGRCEILYVTYYFCVVRMHHIETNTYECIFRDPPGLSLGCYKYVSTMKDDRNRQRVHI